MQKSKLSPPLYLFCMLMIYLFFFLIKSAPEAVVAVKGAIVLCASKVVPSLFPFFVLNRLAVSSGLASAIGKKVGKPISILFRIDRAATFPIIAGCLFGFPVGTSSAVSLFEKGEITKKDAERLICFCSNTGPAFAVGVVGTYLESKRAAFCVYFCQLAAAFLIGFFLGRKKEYDPSPDIPQGISFSPRSIPDAVSSSVSPMLNVCANVCFFSCVSASFDNLLLRFGATGILNSFLGGFLEITRGVDSLQYLCPGTVRIALCAFFVGWSGVSVLLQSIDVISKAGLDCKKFIVCKFLQGCLCAFFCAALCKLLNIY